MDAMRSIATRAIATGPGRLLVTYSDGGSVELDLSSELHGGVFDALSDFSLFSRVEIDEIGGAEWPNGASLAPEFLLSHKPAVRTRVG